MKILCFFFLVDRDCMWWWFNCFQKWEGGSCRYCCLLYRVCSLIIFNIFMLIYSEISYVKCGWIHYISYILVYCPGTSISFHFLKPMVIWALMITALNLCTNMSFHRRLPQGFLLLVYQGWLVLIEIHLLGSKSLTSFWSMILWSGHTISHVWNSKQMGSCSFVWTSYTSCTRKDDGRSHCIVCHAWSVRYSQETYT